MSQFNKFVQVILVLLLFSLEIVAADKLHIGGFLTFAYRRIDANLTYDDNVTKDGEFTKGTKVGLQFHYDISPKIEAFTQVLASGERSRDTSVGLDIAHLNFHYAPRQNLLVGRIRLPVWLTSDFQQVGSLFPWVTPPDEVYEIVPVEEIGAENTFYGASFEGAILGDDRASYRFYFGGNEREDPNRRTNIRVKNLFGLQLSYRWSDLLVKANSLMAKNTGTQEVNGTQVDNSFGYFRFHSLGMNYDNGKWMGMSELSIVTAENRTYEDVRSFYVTGGKFLANQDYLVHLTYSEVLDSSKSDSDIFQRSYAAGVNYNFDLSTVLKFEYKFVDPKKKPTRRPGNRQAEPAGLFNRHPDRGVSFFAVSVNTMF